MKEAWAEERRRRGRKRMDIISAPTHPPRFPFSAFVPKNERISSFSSSSYPPSALRAQRGKEAETEAEKGGKLQRQVGREGDATEGGATPKTGNYKPGKASGW